MTLFQNELKKSRHELVVLKEITQQLLDTDAKKDQEIQELKSALRASASGGFNRASGGVGSSGQQGMVGWGDGVMELNAAAFMQSQSQWESQLVVREEGVRMEVRAADGVANSEVRPEWDRLV